MFRLRRTVWLLLPIFLTACAQMSYRQQAAMKGAVAGAALGAAAGAAGAAASDDDNREGMGIGIGAATGALIGGLLGFFLAEEPKPAPSPAAAPPPPAPAPAPAAEPAPPPAPARPALPPPPPPPPVVSPPPPPPTLAAPTEERTIILEHILFDFDKTAVKPAGARILDRLVTFLNEERNKKVHLEGHTDWIGTERYNQGLSERRAASVKTYLIQKGVDPSRVTTEGFGESRPIADNNTAQGRARNRRVEVKIR